MALDLTAENYKKRGVYLISYGKYRYVGSTSRTFRERMLEHIKENKRVGKLLLAGADVEILWYARKITSKTGILRKEQYFIDNYKANNRITLINEINSYVHHDNIFGNNKNATFLLVLSFIFFIVIMLYIFLK